MRGNLADYRFPVKNLPIRDNCQSSKFRMFGTHVKDSEGPWFLPATMVIMMRPAKLGHSVITDDGQQAASAGTSIWVLHTTGLGANRQLTNLAAALGGTCTVKHTLDSPERAFRDRLMGSRTYIPAAKAQALCPPWPDLLLFGGGRSWLDAVRVRAASGGRSKIVCIGRPGAPLDSVDLTLTTPQYGLPSHPRVLHLDLPLNFVDTERLTTARESSEERFHSLPRPWIGVLLGGDSGSYHLSLDAARRLGRGVAERCRHHAGAALITTSPRTRPAVLDTVLAELDKRAVPNFHYRFVPDDSANPLEGILALADAFVVTADSASMLAEACSTGRPVAAFEPPMRWRARLLARSWMPPWPPVLRRSWAAFRERQTTRGRWVPARRMESIHRKLIERGAIASVEDLDVEPGRTQAGRNDLERALNAIRALVAEPETRTGSDIRPSFAIR